MKSPKKRAKKEKWRKKHLQVQVVFVAVRASPSRGGITFGGAVPWVV